jgi:cytochrome o ubiquinol oxidase subunit 2
MGGVLDPQGPIGAAERLILINATVVMLAVIVPVIVLTLGFAWWFRAGNTRARHMPDWEYSGPVELVVWSIPALIVVFLGGMVWISSHDLDPPKPLASATAKPIEIQVVSLESKWLFIYPDQGVASVNRLAVQTGTPQHFRINS